MALVARADITLFLTRPDVEGITHTRRRLETLGAAANGRDAFGVIIVGDRPYRSGDVAEAVGVPVLGTIAEDPRGAAALGRNARTHSPLAKARLVRSARTLCDTLDGRLRRPAPVDERWASPG